ncbi:MAG: ATP-binding cassette domain-containing protein [Firmicutes bacterium]|nr:ATP-binding cassette domain-containing protein [Bacillota bacterium]
MMLQLQHIRKIYPLKSNDVVALKDVTLSFRKKEFVSILGPSGCGKTTMLNLIGGLDRYTSGDLKIDGISTKDFKDSDWDQYRNHRIGFVFQNYHLIPHLSVIENVALALTLSGESKASRLERAKEVLISVGLNDQLVKKPNQLSGGQQQRVAIARALVNDPDIILADEPTGAIDSKTSRMIMDLLKEISKTRLVIMVTHNPDLAKTYSDRIIEFLDGEVIADSNPLELIASETQTHIKKKTAMSYLTALSLSFKNLLTKKIRTVITAFAGSIGIIGIALILSISNGFQIYITNVQQELLSAVPITIEEQTLILPDSLPTGPPIFQETNPLPLFPNGLFVTPYTPVQQISNYSHFNVLTDDYMTYLDGLDSSLYQDITYRYDAEPLVLRASEEGDIRRISSGSIRMRQLNTDNPDLIDSQYDVLYGRLPEDDALEMVIIISNRNQLRDFILDNLGFDGEDEISFDALINMNFKLVHSGIFYQQNENGKFYSDANIAYNSEEAVDLKIVGIIRIQEGVDSELLSEGFGYTQAVMDHILEASKDAPIIEALTANLEAGGFEGPYPSVFDDAVYERRSDVINLLQFLGAEQFPSRITIYANDFSAKESVSSYLSAYNDDIPDSEVYRKIIHTDFTQTLSSYLSQIVTNITYLLVALSGISLLVSSVLIGIITYVSVIERTKEIGVLRAIGARKKDISRVFNAETIIIGFLSGSLGILVTVLLNPIINSLIERFADIKNIAVLNPLTALTLIILSIALTLIAGFIPAKIASRKDPVVALRTE